MSEVSNQKTVVNSWNEWAPLRHIIIGVATGTMVQAPEPACQRNWPQYDFPYPTYGPLPREMEDKANEQLDGFASMLEKRGIRVDRPTPIDFSQTVQTPDWVQESMFGVMPPRDLLLTVGTEILEPSAVVGTSISATGRCWSSTSRRTPTSAGRQPPSQGLLRSRTIAGNSGSTLIG